MVEFHLSALLVVSHRIARRHKRDLSMKRQNRSFSKCIARAASRARRNRSTKRWKATCAGTDVKKELAGYAVAHILATAGM